MSDNHQLRDLLSSSWRREERSSSSSTSCLICSVGFERKPSVMMTIGGGDDEDDECRDGGGGGWGTRRTRHAEEEEFREALRLFWKLLRRDDDEVVVAAALEDECGGWGEKEGESGQQLLLWSPPCCSECGGALVKILELQRLIDQSLVEQTGHVKSLKDALELSPGGVDDSDDGESDVTRSEDFWHRVRRQLMACVVSNIRGSSKAGGGGGGEGANLENNLFYDEDYDYDSPQEDDDDNDNDDSTDPLLPLEVELQEELEQQEEPSKNVCQPKKDAKKNPFLVGQGIGITTTTKRKRGSQKLKLARKQQKMSKVVVMEELKEETSSSLQVDLRRIRPCSVALERIDLTRPPPQYVNHGVKIGKGKLLPDAGDDDDDDACIKSEKEMTLDNIDNDDSLLQPHEIVGGSRRLRPYSKFLSLGNDHFLYHFSPVQFSNNSFKCLDEPAQCSFVSQGSDFSAFHRMAAHIDEVHVPARNYTTKPRQCPLLCRTEVLLSGDGPSFMRHARQAHSATSTCQICWKPIVNSTYYRYHLWTHKNAQEKADAVSAGSPNMDIVMGRMRRRKTEISRQSKRRNNNSIIVGRRRNNKSVVVARRGQGQEVGRRSRSEESRSQSRFLLHNDSNGGVDDSDPGRVEEEEEEKPNISGLLRQSKLRAIKVIRKSLRRTRGGGGGSGSSEVNNSSSSDDEPEIKEENVSSSSKTKKSKEDDGEFLVSDSDTDSSSQESRGDVSDAGGGGDAEYSPTTTTPSCKCKQKKFHRAFITTPNVRLARRRPKSDSFFLMGAEHLLYQNTAIHFSPMGFTCLEEGRGSKGTCSSTDYSSFRELRHHIAHDHAEGDYSTKPRRCILCAQQFPDGVHLKNHLILCHQAEFKFVCESCWNWRKPVPQPGFRSGSVSTSTGQLFQEEQSWTHENEEEKKAGGMRRRRRNKVPRRKVEERNQEMKPSSPNHRVQRKFWQYFGTNPNSTSLRRRMPKSDAFFLLGGDGEQQQYLLYKNTSIKVSPGVGLTCLEQGCSKRDISGTDYNAFQAMRHHIVSDHNDENYPIVRRGCVLCLEEFPDGANLKYHLLSSHHPQEFRHVCEVCWKPYQLSCTRDLQQHAWTHKSEEEKKESAKDKKGGAGGAVGLKNYLKPEKTHHHSKVKRLLGRDHHHHQSSKIKYNNNSGIKWTSNGQKRKWNRFFSDHPNSVKRRKPKSDAFFLLGSKASHLLYKHTSIEVSPGGFTCLEEGCCCSTKREMMIPGTDYNAFQELRHHVLNEHGDDADYSTKPRACVLCLEQCSDGTSLKNHLLMAHSRKELKLVCESCWKPVRLSLKQLRTHSWTHKSAEERREAAEHEAAAAARRLPKPDPRIATKQQRRKRLENERRMLLKLKRDTTAAGVGVARSVRHGNMFMRISESLLIHKFTLVQFSEGKLTCLEPECGESSTTTEGVAESDFQSMRAHIANSHEGEYEKSHSRPCPVCSELFDTTKSFRLHIFTSHEPATGICEICCKPVLTAGGRKDAFRAHLWSHKNETELASSIAACQPPDTFLRLVEAAKEGAEEVETLSTGRVVELHTCSECGKVLRSATGLTAHKETHLPRALRKQFVCEECGLSLLSAVALRSHISRAHKPELQRPQRICPICERRFHHRDGEAYRSHLRSHTNERPFMCEQCGQGFFNKDRLKSHAVSHSDVKLLQCEYCEKGYKARKALRRHMLASHKEHVVPAKEEILEQQQQQPRSQPVFIGPKIAFPCDHCDKVFPQRSRMTKHVKESHARPPRW